MWFNLKRAWEIYESPWNVLKLMGSWVKDMTGSADTGHWETEGFLPNPQKYHGFIYLITNELDGRGYIGKKSYGGGKPWREYISSSKYLQEDINKLGKENFTFTMLFECNNRAHLGYSEEAFLWGLRVLESDKWYNRAISKRRYVPPEVGTSEHQEMFKASMSEVIKVTEEEPEK